MKINGKSLDSHRIVKVYLPVTDGAVEFRFRPLRSSEDFEKIMSRPKPPKKMRPGGAQFANMDDPGYKRSIAAWAENKMDWEFLICISETEGLEWETVDMGQPETWKNWRSDLEKVFSPSEVNQVYSGFFEAQYITEDVMEKARATFLIGALAASNGPQCPTEEVDTTPSGEPAKE